VPTSATRSCSSPPTSPRPPAPRCPSTAASRTHFRDDRRRARGVTGELAERLAADVARRFDVARVEIAGLRRLAGGASRETWAFDAVRPDGTTERLVLRRDPPGHHIRSSRRDEFVLLEAAGAAGLPVPRVRWCEDDDTILGSPYFVMDFVDGETLA